MSDLLSLCKELVEANNGHDPLDVNECIHRIRDLLAQHPSDPKHLPPRDCLVFIECPAGYSAQPVFVHVLFEEETGDYDEEGRVHGHAARWMDAVEGEEIDPSRVITWRELPEVE